MAEDRKRDDKPKPFNHVLEVQNGRIDVRDLIKHIDKGLKKEAHDGKNST